jgi:tRNA pseudouridine38-40 synthase
VQQVLEEAFSLILREEIQITGCGRTDAGVHAQQYFFHLDTAQELSNDILPRFNRYLPEDIALRNVYIAPDDASARYDAVQRTYQYYLRFAKDPLSPGLALWYPFRGELDLRAMNEVGALLKSYQAFKPFCKEGSDARHYLCAVSEAHWIESDQQAFFTISANRFLRGMVRLIVGTCLQVGRGKLDLQEVKAALDTQSPMPRAESVPAHGLHLISVQYPVELLRPVPSGGITSSHPDKA